MSEANEAAQMDEVEETNKVKETNKAEETSKAEDLEKAIEKNKEKETNKAKRMNEAREMNDLKQMDTVDVSHGDLCRRLKSHRSLPCVGFFPWGKPKAVAEEWVNAGYWEDTRRVGCRHGYCVHQCDRFAPQLWCYSDRAGALRCDSHEDCKVSWLQWRKRIIRPHPTCIGKCEFARRPESL